MQMSEDRCGVRARMMVWHAFIIFCQTACTLQGMSGFTLGQHIKDKCGMRASMTAELVFDKCIVPKENLVGEEGKAVICMMRNLEIERLCLAAMSCGIARRCVLCVSSLRSAVIPAGRARKILLLHLQHIWIPWI